MLLPHIEPSSSVARNSASPFAPHVSTLQMFRPTTTANCSIGVSRSHTKGGASHLGAQSFLLESLPEEENTSTTEIESTTSTEASSDASSTTEDAVLDAEFIQPSQKERSPIDCDGDESYLTQSFDEQRLDWRHPPEESLSDWTIEVTTLDGDDDDSDVYHVHKSVLAFGPRRSQYFATLLRGRRDPSTATVYNTSCFQLPTQSVAATMPLLLDYVYDLPSFQMTADNAADLHYLAQNSVFGVRRLQRVTLQCMVQDLTVDNCHMYYEHTLGMPHDGHPLLAAIETLCARCLPEATQASILTTMARPSVWCRILRHPEACARDRSRVVLRICQQHRDAMHPRVFQQVTHVDVLPTVDPETAMAFLELEHAICGETSDPPKLTCLQRRCIDAVVRDSSAVPPMLLPDCLRHVPHVMWELTKAALLLEQSVSHGSDTLESTHRALEQMVRDQGVELQRLRDERDAAMRRIQMLEIQRDQMALAYFRSEASDAEDHHHHNDEQRQWFL